MSWLNLNTSLNSLKGQITNFASEVLSEGTSQESGDNPSGSDSGVKELQQKCQDQQLEIESLKKLTEELQSSLERERLARKNGVKEEESSWYWDPPPQKPIDEDKEEKYQTQIQSLQDELSNLRERGTLDIRQDDEELNRLREENALLTSNLEDLDSQHQQAMERLLSLKKELQKNFEVLKQEHEDLKSTNVEFAEQIKVFQIKLAEKDKHIQELTSEKSDYDTLHHKYQNLERIHGLLRENAEKFQEENQELHEEVFKLQEEVTKLEHDIELITKHSDDIVPRVKYEQVLKELNELKERRNVSQVHLDEVNIDDNAKSVIENLKRDIHELKHKLEQGKTKVQDDKKTVSSDKIIHLYNKYVDFELPVDYVGEMPSGDDNNVVFKLETAFKTLHAFKREIDMLENKLSEKNSNIKHLQTQIEDLTTENDFLTTDVHHFEKELNEMKKNNDFLISEIAALKNTSKLEPIMETHHEDNLVKLESELADCNRMNKTFESEIKRIETELSEVRSEKISLQNSLTDLKEKYVVMFNELDMCKSETKAASDFESNVIKSELDEKLNGLLNETDNLKKQLNISNTRNEKLAIDIQIIENDKVLLTKEIDDLKHAFESLINENESLKITYSELQYKYKDLKSILDLENQNKTEDMKKNTSNINNSEIINQLGNVSKENASLKEQLDNLKSELTTLKTKYDQLEFEKINLEKIKYELQANVTVTETINKEIINLKAENRDLVNIKLQLEAELTSTDDKIVSLEQEFEKLVSDLREKDNIIDSLNSTISRHVENLTNLNQNIEDLENSIAVKNQEIEKLRSELTNATETLKNLSDITNKNEELNQTVINERDEAIKQVAFLQEALSLKSNEMSNLQNVTQLLEKTMQEHKTSAHEKDKEIQELHKAVVELREKLKSDDNHTANKEEYTKFVQEKEALSKDITKLKETLAQKELTLQEFQNKCNAIEAACQEYKNTVEKATNEKEELVKLITLKHNESLQYHNEIQRLNHVILEQNTEYKRIIEEKESALANKTECCSTCNSLKMTLKEKDEIIMVLNQNISEFDKIKNDLQRSSDTIKALSEKCENLDKSLAIQLETVKKLSAENLQLSEQEANSSRELSRLREHLIELEQNYTSELMSSEQKVQELQGRLMAVEQRAKQTSTVYTSNSIRANQEVETLRNQIKLLEKQREDVQVKLMEAEEANIRSEAALTNLQLVLQQFQLDKERDIEAATERIRGKMAAMKKENGDLQQEISRLNAKLEESLAGLQAATRLGDQLETKSAIINDLKEQVRTLQTSVSAAEERYYSAISNQQDRVDKNLVKNLVVNYSLAQGLNRTQVLRILSTVLDFNQQECTKLGLTKPAPTDSIATEFVKFLERESRPAVQPSVVGLTTAGSRSQTPVLRKNSGLGPQPDPYSMAHSTGHTRNPSTGSNNLLFQNLDHLETSSQVSHISQESERDGRPTGIAVAGPGFDGGNVLRNNESAILKHVLKDM